MIACTRPNLNPLASARLTPSACASFREVLVENLFLPLSAWETRCCEWIAWCLLACEVMITHHAAIHDITRIVAANPIFALLVQGGQT